MESDGQGARPAKKKAPVKAATAAFVAKFGRLPPEVKALGRPVSVHAPNWLSTLTGSGVNRVGLLVASAVLLTATAAAYTYYRMQANVAGVHPDAWQLIAAGFGVPGLGSLLSWMRVRRGGGGASDAGVGFLVYDEALVRAAAAGYTAIRWDEVKAIVPPMESGTYGRWGPTRVVARDGRSIDLSFKVAGEGTLLGTTYERVLAQLVPACLARIAAGETVTIGGLGLSQDGLTWKRKSLAWGHITGLLIVYGASNGLRITAGRFGLWTGASMSTGASRTAGSPWS